ncbi:MAG: hypothetical protein QCI00_08870 [Candidatus Thermoplasmatota archaeon]|nr:hypothetical protein [Candidatus Thermoplasmatota archaeon]
MKSQINRKIYTAFFSIESSFFFVLSIFLLFTNLLFSGCIQPDGSTDDTDHIEVTSGDLELRQQFALDWFTDNINENDYFNYLYDPESNEYPLLNNMVRQLLASRLLAELSQQDEKMVPAHNNNLEYIFSQWYTTDASKGYIYYDGESNLGANAMALRTLIASPLYDDYELIASHLTYTILSLQHENGSFDPFFISPTYKFDEVHLLKFYSGQTILALLELYEKTKNESLYDAALLSQRYYYSLYVENISTNYHPSFVPWHSQTLYRLYKLTNNNTYATAVFILNDLLIEMQEKTNTSVLGRFFDPLNPLYGSYHSSSDALYTEGLVYAYRLAYYLNDTERMQRYQTAFLLGSLNLISLQYTNISDANTFGGVRYGVDDGRIRVDNVVHTIEAFDAISSVMNQQEPWIFTYDISTSIGMVNSS